MIELLPREWKLILWALGVCKKADAIHAHIFERARIGSENVAKRYNAIVELMEKIQSMLRAKAR